MDVLKRLTGFHERLETRVNEIVDDLEAKKERIEAGSITLQLLAEHASGLKKGKAGDWMECASYDGVRDNVRVYINRRLAPTGKGKHHLQYVFAGFEKLQEYYPVTRDGKQVHVHRTEMSAAEWFAKESEYRAQAAGLNMHADACHRAGKIKEREEKRALRAKVKAEREPIAP